jgi:hypothetical protein
MEATHGHLRSANSPQCANKTRAENAYQKHPEQILISLLRGFLGYAALVGQSSVRLNINQALSPSPHDPQQNIVFMVGVGQAYYQARRYSEAANYTHNVANSDPSTPAPIGSGGESGPAGRMEEARNVSAAWQMQPNVACLGKKNLPYPDAMKHYLDGLRKAGLE